VKDFFSKVLATLLAAAVVANVTLLWRMDSRLTRIETVLQVKQIAHR
jgi:hypothetical protein